MRRVLLLASVFVAATACRKPEPPPPAPVPVAPAPSASAPAPFAPAPEPRPEPKSASTPEPAQGNWFSTKPPGEKQEIMEGWLYQYSTGNAATKAEIVKQVQNSKLSAADKAMVEGIRARLKLPPMPLQ